MLGGLCFDPGGDDVEGDLSGDSESSLNPSQVLSGNDLALARAQARTAEAEEHMEDLRNGTAEDSALAGTSGEEEIEFSRFSGYLNLKGEFFDRDRDANDQERSYTGETAGVQIGGDYLVTDALIAGALFGIDIVRSEFDQDAVGANFTPPNNDGSSDGDSYYLQVYASHTFGDAFYVDGTAGFGYNDYTFIRKGVFQETDCGIPQTNVLTKAGTQGWQASGSFGGGYDFYHDAWSIGPHARVNYSRSEIDGFTERDLNGSGLAVTVGDSNSTSLTTVLGGHASFAISTEWGVLVPQARIEWEHEYRDDAHNIDTQFVNDAAGTVFAVRTDAPDRDYFNLGFSLLGVLPNGIMPFLDF